LERGGGDKSSFKGSKKSVLVVFIYTSSKSEPLFNHLCLLPSVRESKYLLSNDDRQAAFVLPVE
jgi:hypothetical protein